MASLTDGLIRQALKRVELTGKQENLVDGEGRGTGRLVLVLKPMPTRVTADWMALQWRDGRRTKKKIGAYPSTSLAQARELFKRDFADVIQKGRSIKIAGDTRPGTVGDLFEAYVNALKASDKPSWKETEKGLNKVADTLGRNRLARDVEADEIVEVIRPIYERGSRAMADHVRCYIHAAYSWGMKSEHDYRTASSRRFRIAFNPATGIPTEPKVQGTRWLDETEFVRLYRWLECPDTPVHPSYPRAVRLIMLTGQRVEEIARLNVDQWDSTEHIIDWSKTKNLQPHAVPVPSLAAELIDFDHPERVRLVFPVSQRCLPARQPWDSLQLHLASEGPRGHPFCHEPRSASHMENAGRQSRSPEGNPRPDPKSRTSGRQLQKLRPLELHAGEARWHGQMGRVCARPALQQETAAGRMKPMQPSLVKDIGAGPANWSCV